MTAIREASYLDGYRIALVFADGASGVIDLSDVIGQFSQAAPLRDIELFRQFVLDGWPTLVWPNGFDLSPEMLYERATGKRIDWLHEPRADVTERGAHA